MRRLFALFALLAALVPAVAAAQAPAAVPALPDSARITSYSLSASTCSACSVGFALYGTGTDYGNWIEVWIVTGSGSSTVATKLTAVTDYTLSSVSGALATLPRPITNATITLTSARTGTLYIVGANRPRRLSQFAENRGVAARDLNVAVTDLVAENRELWDKMSRALITPPGDTIGNLPVAAVRAGGLLAFDGSGNPMIQAQLTGLGNVIGPLTSVVGHIPCFANTTGTLLSDCGTVGAGDVTGPASATDGQMVRFNGATGKIVKAGGPIVTDSTGTLTIVNGKTLTLSNTLTFTGTDGSSVAFGAGGTAAYTANNLSVFAATTSAQLAGVLSDETGTGAAVFANTPTLVTPVLGVATATSINKVALTAPVTAATLTIADGKTLTANASLTLAGTDAKTLTVSNSGTLAGGDGFTLAIAAAKTLTVSNSLTLAGTDGKTLTLSNSGTVAGGDGFTLAIGAAKTFTVSNSLTFTGADGTSFAFPATSDTVATVAATQTLTNKTLTAPVINGGTAAALTAFGIRSSGTGAFDLTLANSENLTAGRTLTLTLNNASRTLSLSGNLTTAADFTTAGANALTLTTTGATNVTLPTSGALATRDTAQTFSSTNTFSALQQFTDIRLSSGRVYPLADGTTALQLCKADGVTCVVRLDTTNARVGINKTPGAFDLDVNGAVNVGSTLTFTTLDATSLSTSTSTVTGLTINNSPSSANDYIPYYSAVDGRIRRATVGAIAAGATAGVSSLNGLTGGLSIVAGNGLSVSAAGSSVTVASPLEPGSITNCTLTGTVAANALTVALKTQSGADPSASSPCTVSFRNATAATGDYTAVLVTAATSFSTGTSGSTFGSSNSTAFRLWITAFNNAGTVVLGVSNQSTATQIYAIDEGAVQSSTACSACTTATSAGVYYTTAAQTSKAIRILGYMEWSSGLATAGTWASGPTTIQMFGPGVARPGDTLAVVYATTTTPFSTTSTTFVSTGFSASITPRSTVNLIRIDVSGELGSTANDSGYGQISRGTTNNTNMIGSMSRVFTGTQAGRIGAHMMAFDKPQTTSAQAYAIQLRSGAGAAAEWIPSAGAPGGTGTMLVTEIMG